MSAEPASPRGSEYVLVSQGTTDVWVCAYHETVHLMVGNFSAHLNEFQDVDLTAAEAREVGVKLIEAAADAEWAERFSQKTQQLLTG